MLVISGMFFHDHVVDAGRVGVGVGVAPPPPPPRRQPQALERRCATTVLVLSKFQVKLFP